MPEPTQPTQPNYNLDDVSESFTFLVGGNLYNFRHMDTNQMEEMSKLKDDKSKTYLFQFITPQDAKSPSIEEATKHFTIPMWKAFYHMVETEFSVEDLKLK